MRDAPATDAYWLCNVKLRVYYPPAELMTDEQARKRNEFCEKFVSPNIKWSTKPVDEWTERYETAEPQMTSLELS